MSKFGGLIGYCFQRVVKTILVGYERKRTGLSNLEMKIFLSSQLKGFLLLYILGSQADSYLSIVGQGASSSQTEGIFKKLVKDCVVQIDDTIMISNTRKDIQDTNVTLNLAISPALINLPSNIVTLKQKIPGYNNVLAIASKKLISFGRNLSFNKAVEN